MKKYDKKYCPTCGKMNTIDPLRPHKKCKFCGSYLTAPLFPWYNPSNPMPKPNDPDNDNDIDPDIDDPPHP